MLADIFKTVDTQYDASLTLARKAASAAPRSGSAIYGGSGQQFDNIGMPDRGNAARQYAALKDHQWSAIRPIAVRVADQSQSFRVGTKKKSTESPVGRGMVAKSARRKKGADSDAPRLTLKQANIAPNFVKAIAEGIEPIENHPLIDVFNNPNPDMTGWATMWCTAISLVATGSAYWLVEDAPPVAEGEAERPPLQLYYLPVHWVREVHVEVGGTRRQIGWKVVPDGVAEEDASPLPMGSVIQFMFSDPANPTKPLSPMQTQAKAINTDGEIQTAQFALMKNGIRPGIVLHAGRLPAPPGQSGPGPLPSLTPEQKQELLGSIRAAYQGAVHTGDPIIIDAMIEAITPYTNSAADLDFLNGSELTKQRIYAGIGTSEIVAGMTQNSNRASAYVAQDAFNVNVVNPIITLISQVVTMKLGPRFEKDGESLYIWMDKAEASDADLKLSQITLAMTARAITKNEIREFLDLKPLEKGGDELAGPDPVPPAGSPPGTDPQKPNRGGNKSGDMQQLVKQMQELAAKFAEFN